MEKVESKLQGKLTSFLKGEGGARWMDSHGMVALLYEVKACGTSEGRIPFSGVADHQMLALMHGAGLRGARAMAHKISDSAIGYKPCDGFVMRRADAWLILGWRVKGKGWATYGVEVATAWPIMYDEDERRKRGSFTREWCKENGELIPLT